MLPVNVFVFNKKSLGFFSEAGGENADYGVNDCSKHELTLLGDSTRRAFLEFLDEPASSPLWERDGLYSVHTFGPPGERVMLILLDTRYNRDRFNDSSGSMLGQPQWRWLERTLNASDADVHLIGSSVLVQPSVLVRLFGVMRHVEGWFRMPHEAQRLLRLLDSVPGVILLSGDVHHGAIETSAPGCLLSYELNELTSSGMTHTLKYEKPVGDLAKSRCVSIIGNLGNVLVDRDYAAGWPQGHFAPYLGLNFGLVSFNWSARTIRLAVRDSKGTDCLVKTVAIDSLQPARKTASQDASYTCKPSISRLRAEYFINLVLHILSRLLRSWTTFALVPPLAVLYYGWSYVVLQFQRAYLRSRKKHAV